MPLLDTGLILLQDHQPVHLAPVQQPAQIDRLQRAVDEGAHYQREALKLRQQQLERGAVVGRRKMGRRQQAAQVAAQRPAGRLSAGPGSAASYRLTACIAWQVPVGVLGPLRGQRQSGWGEAPCRQHM